MIQLGGGWLTCNCLTVRESGEVLERWPLGPAGDNTARATQPLVERALSLYLQLLRTRYGVQFIALFQYHCRRVSLGGGSCNESWARRQEMWNQNCAIDSVLHITNKSNSKLENLHLT